MNKILIATLFTILFSTNTFAEWAYQENTDPMTDKDTSMAISPGGHNELVGVRCNGTGNFDILVAVGEYLGSDKARVNYRFDRDDPVYAGSWSLSTNGMMAFAPASKTQKLIKQFKLRDTVIFQITDFRGSKPTSSFRLAGSVDALDQLSCIN